MSKQPFDPLGHAMHYGGQRLGVNPQGLDPKILEQVQSLPYDLRPNDLVTQTHRGNKVVRRATATVLSLALGVGGGLYAFSRFHYSNEETVTLNAPIELGKITYANSGKLVAYYTSTDGNITALSETSTGGALPIEDIETVSISVVQNKDDGAITQTASERQVDRSAFSLTSGFSTETQAQTCDKDASIAKGSSCTTVTLVNGTITADNASADESKRVAALLSITADKKPMTPATVTGAYTKLISGALKTPASTECLKLMPSLADAAIAGALPQDGKTIVFVGNYTSVSNEYDNRRDTTKPILGTTAIGVKDIATTCKEVQAS